MHQFSYADIVGEIEEHGGTDRIEVRIARDGSIAVNGWATDEALAALLDDLGAPARPARPAMSASAARTSRHCRCTPGPGWASAAPTRRRWCRTS